MIRKSPWVNLHHHSTKFNLVCLMVSPVFLQGFIQFTLGFFLDFLLVLLYNWGQSQHTNMACASSLLATQLTRLRWKGHCPSSPDREFKNYVWIALQFPLLDLYSWLWVYASFPIWDLHSFLYTALTLMFCTVDSGFTPVFQSGIYIVFSIQRWGWGFVQLTLGFKPDFLLGFAQFS